MRIRTILLLSVGCVIAGCSSDSAPPPMTEQEVTSIVATNARQDVRGLVDTIKQMQRDGDDLEAFRDELMPTFVDYVANDQDPHHAIYKRMRNAWEDIGGDNTAEALKELEAAYKELP